MEPDRREQDREADVGWGPVERGWNRHREMNRKKGFSGDWEEGSGSADSAKGAAEAVARDGERVETAPNIRTPAQ